ncbi:MAG: hypothetical protein EOO31_01355 [Comamonadaceae bacterium]|nr:MAG: hypothetical protein EOO31_01355 [Comamonadaceae bacterium]
MISSDYEVHNLHDDGPVIDFFVWLYFFLGIEVWPFVLDFGVFFINFLFNKNFWKEMLFIHCSNVCGFSFDWFGSFDFELIIDGQVFYYFVGYLELFLVPSHRSEERCRPDPCEPPLPIRRRQPTHKLSAVETLQRLSATHADTGGIHGAGAHRKGNER